MSKFRAIGILFTCLFAYVSGQADDTSGQQMNICNVCSCTFNVTDKATFNCSRRHLDRMITEWPEELSNGTEGKYVLIKFNDNEIRVLPQLPGIRGNRVAISLQRSQLVEIESAAFMNVKNIFYLDLSRNHLTGDNVRGDIFRGAYDIREYEPISLQSLYLGHNSIHSLDRRMFEHTPNLTVLYLNNNPLEMLDYATTLAISSASKLEILDLSYTDIDFIPIDLFRGILHLRQLDLSGNRFTVVPQALGELGHSLEFLTINRNQIAELNEDSFLGLFTLKALEVSENEALQEVRAGTFSQLQRLTVLHLCHNPNLQYISRNAFRNLKDSWPIKEVYLDGNNLSELPSGLMPWKKVDVLGLSGNAWLCDCNLANVIVQKGAGEKIPEGEIPTCISPMTLSGMYITEMQPENCIVTEERAPDEFRVSIMQRRFSFNLTNPVQIVWVLVGSSLVVFFGTLLGFAVAYLKMKYKQRQNFQPIKYVNVNNSAETI